MTGQNHYFCWQSYNTHRTQDTGPLLGLYILLILSSKYHNSEWAFHKEENEDKRRHCTIPTGERKPKAG